MSNASIPLSEPNADHSYHHTLESLKRKMNEENEKVQSLKKKFYNSNKKATRLKEAVSNLEAELSKAYEQFDVDKSKHILIDKAASSVPMKLLKLSVDNDQVYDPVVRKFALTLHFYSPKAYRFIRKAFNKALPHENTLYRWCCKLDASPGFTEQSFLFIKKKIEQEQENGKDILFALMLDEMKIHRHLSFNGKEFVGGVDFGMDLNEDDDEPEEATDALVMMVVGLNVKWKLPIGYFLIKGMTGSEKANLVNIALKKLGDVGASICTLTSDGPHSNQAMAKILGANLDPEAIDPLLSKSDSNQKTYSVLDSAHMAKLTRNCFGDYQVLYKSDRKAISWNYIVELHKLQEEKGLHLGNKLTRSHVYYQDNKMKVKLATQLLSKSVADSIAYARDSLKLAQFECSEATEKFIRNINDCFDIQNTENLNASGFKAPLCSDNKDKIFSKMDELSAYLSDLQDSKGKKLVYGARKTGFLGFMLNFETIKLLYRGLVENGPLKFILTNKLSQDHLEHFFGRYNGCPTKKC